MKSTTAFLSVAVVAALVGATVDGARAPRTPATSSTTESVDDSRPVAAATDAASAPAANRSPAFPATSRHYQTTICDGPRIGLRDCVTHATRFSFGRMRTQA